MPPRSQAPPTICFESQEVLTKSTLPKTRAAVSKSSCHSWEGWAACSSRGPDEVAGDSLDREGGGGSRGSGEVHPSPSKAPEGLSAALGIAGVADNVTVQDPRRALWMGKAERRHGQRTRRCGRPEPLGQQGSYVQSLGNGTRGTRLRHCHCDQFRAILCTPRAIKEGKSAGRERRARGELI